MHTLLMKRMTTAKGVNCLVACDELAEQDLATFPAGKPVMVDARQGRSTPHMRLFFGMIRKIARSTPTRLDEKALLSWVKVRSGHVDVLPLGFGKTYEAPASIAYDNMDQMEFKAFFERAVELILTEVAPNLPDTFTAELLAMLSDDTPSSEGSRAA